MCQLSCQAANKWASSLVRQNIAEFIAIVIRASHTLSMYYICRIYIIHSC